MVPAVFYFQSLHSHHCLPHLPQPLLVIDTLVPSHLTPPTTFFIHFDPSPSNLVQCLYVLPLLRCCFYQRTAFARKRSEGLGCLGKRQSGGGSPHRLNRRLERKC